MNEYEREKENTLRPGNNNSKKKNNVRKRGL